MLDFINLQLSLVIYDENHLKKMVNYWFFNMNFEYYHITFWDVSKITNMNEIFSHKFWFNELLLWNMTNVNKNEKNVSAL